MVLEALIGFTWRHGLDGHDWRWLIFGEAEGVDYDPSLSRNRPPEADTKTRITLRNCGFSLLAWVKTRKPLGLNFGS